MSFAALPAAAAWQHQGARAGFEVVYFQPLPDGCRIEGWTTAVENGQSWAVGYQIRLDAGGATRSVRIVGRSASGSRSRALAADGTGRWRVDGEPDPGLDGCLDVDLESSAFTNAMPIRRLGLPVGGRASAPAAYVRAVDLSVVRLEQTYVRVEDGAGGQQYDYAAPAFDFADRLRYDEFGLVLDYPGIAVRAA